ncbi:adenylate/guanylate cyclase [Nitzschia inconspicua]|uniref:Adenylate/guanylate cyclase n=1 Tax=Nitzschia inconspicua TaxID=303405 RepID=A0A9K3L233_9STRA|nr:adenylate/guanylate cyclase [Nitzschia inconspicua]
MPREAPDDHGDVLRSASLPSANGPGVIVSRSVVRKPPRKASSGDRLIDMRAAYRVSGNNGIGQNTPRNNRQRFVARAVMEMSSGSLGSLIADDEEDDADTINSNFSSGSVSLKQSPKVEDKVSGRSLGPSPDGSSSHGRRRSSSMSRKSSTGAKKPQSSRSTTRNSKQKEDEKELDRSSRSERRSDRRSAGSTTGRNGTRLRSSSRKRSGRSDRASESRCRSRSLNEKTNGRSRRASVTQMSVPKTTRQAKRGSVTEDEILEMLSLDYEVPLADAAIPVKQRERSSSRDSSTRGSGRISNSPHSDASKLNRRSQSPMERHQSAESFSSGESHKNQRGSNSVTENKGIDRSNSAETPSRQKTRAAPRRVKSDDAPALDSFFRQNEHVNPRKKAAGSRSVASMPAKANQRIRSNRSEGRRESDRTDDTDDTTIPSSINSSLGPSHDDSFKERMGTSGTFHYHNFDDSETDDTVSIDLDLATARTSFQQQNLNEKLQMHLSKTDELLYSVFPKHVADSLRNGQKVEPENHDLVTIFFSDIVGFTDISSKLDPLKISDMLDRLYHSFDALSDYHDVFKVETIGDAYMAVTNLAKKQPDHCKRISEFAIDAIRVANQTLIDEDNPDLGFVNIRVGFHSGPVVSNVVGTRNPRYCLFGDTVNTASRMESNSEENRIHCSEASALLLRQQCPKIRIFPRGTIEVKGKGEMHTFWVHMEGSTKSSTPSKNGVIRDVKNVFKSLRGERAKKVAA